MGAIVPSYGDVLPSPKTRSRDGLWLTIAQLVTAVPKKPRLAPGSRLRARLRWRHSLRVGGGSRVSAEYKESPGRAGASFL
jgi:hypothetical protein